MCEQPLQADAALDELVAEVLSRVVQLAAEGGVPMVFDGVVRAALQQLGQRGPLVGVNLLRLQQQDGKKMAGTEAQGGGACGGGAESG